MEKLRLRLFHEVDSVENEDKCLAEFRREMELLQQEKMAHVEELRQIHADINAVRFPLPPKMYNANNYHPIFRAFSTL